MALTIYKDFLGLNLCIYDPIAEDTGSYSWFYPSEAAVDNVAGYASDIDQPYWYNGILYEGNIGPITNPSTTQILVLLNLHRNGHWGYGSWKQLRASHNHLSRYQRRNNIFTYVKEPGKKYQIVINNKNYDHLDRFSKIKSAVEPVVVNSYKPLEVIGGVSLPNLKTNKNEIKSVSVKTTFSNETVFFANDEVNNYYDTILETDESYEELKGLYLDGSLGEASSPLERFNMMIYKQTVWPKMQYAYLNKTRSRSFFINTSWKSHRSDRLIKNKSNGFDITIPKRSMWNLDAGSNFKTLITPSVNITPAAGTWPNNQNAMVWWNFPIGGSIQNQKLNSAAPVSWLTSQYNTTGASGILQNSYSHLFAGYFRDSHSQWSPVGLGPPGGQPPGTPYYQWGYRAGDPIWYTTEKIDSLLTASCLYSRKHTLDNLDSFASPTGLRPTEVFNAVQTPASIWKSAYNNFAIDVPLRYLFRGEAAWDAGRQSGKAPTANSYKEFSTNIRKAAQGYTIVPEFRISNHVETYEKLGITEELESIFELSGATKTVNTTTATDKEFYTILSNSDFLKHFDLVKKDHRDFVDPSILTLRCKAIKKLLPYEGFYPQERCVQLSKQFFQSYKDHCYFQITGATASETSFAAQTFLEPLFAPGVLFNSIKSGIAVDYPVIAEGASPSGVFVNSTGDDANGSNKKTNALITGSQDFFQNQHLWGNLEGCFTKRIPFEALVNPAEYLSNLPLNIQEPHPFGLGGLQISSIWNGGGTKIYEKMMSNFLAEVPEFFMKNQNFSTLSSLESQDVNFGNAEKGKFYCMRIKMYRSKNRANDTLRGFGAIQVTPPQDLFGSSHKSGKEKHKMRETFTMYSRPTAFGPPIDDGGWPKATYANYSATPFGRFQVSGSSSLWGYNWAYTPPYYHGDAWCDLVFECTASGKYTANEIIRSVKSYPYYTRFWWNGINDALRDLTGYRTDQDRVDPGGSGGSNNSAGGYLTTGLRFWQLYKNQTPINPQPFQIAGVPENPIDIEGKYKHYHDGPWHRLIKKGKVGKGHIGCYSPTLGIYNNGNMNNVAGQGSFIKPPSNKWPDVSVGGKLDIGTLMRPRWGSRWNMDGYSVASGAWAGPPYNDARQREHVPAPYHPFYLNMNALQLNSSVNLFGLGTVKKIKLDGHEGEERAEVATSETNQAKSRWIIQPKFETPMLNFNKYTDLKKTNCTSPYYGSESVPRGMWHQYGEIPSDAKTGVFLQVEDVPVSWLKGALGIDTGAQKAYVRSLADLVGMPKTAAKLGQVAEVKQIGECVVAVPFFEEKGERRFFTIPRADIDETVSALRREVEPGVFVAGGPPKVGNTVVEMVKKMRNYVFPPSMDFVKYPEIQPFAMYIFEFTHNFTRQDLADIWQNLSPEIGRSFQQAEVSISHELLAHELLGGGAQIANDKLNENAKGQELRPNIQWMMFKVKKRAKTNYFDKVVAKKGTSGDTSQDSLENVDNAELGENPEVTYNWPYDYFSLVELVKLDAEITFAQIGNDDKGNRTILPIKKPTEEEKKEQKQMSNDIATALGNGSTST